MTTKFTITRIVKTMMPMTKLPPMTKRPKASMTWPAASGPSWPCARISRVEARLSASRSMVAISSTVGKAENSSGAWMNSDVIRISTEKVMEMASAKSSSSGGSGRMSTTRMAIMPTASPMSLRRSMVPRSASRVKASTVRRRARPKLRRSCRLIAPVGCGHVFRSCARRPYGPPARRKEKEPHSRPRLPPKVRWKRTRTYLPRQNVPGIWLPGS